MKITHDTQIVIGKILAVIIIISACVGVGIIIGERGLKSPLASQGELEFQSIQEVWELLHTEYLNANDLNDKDLVIGAIRGMLQTLDDPHTTFFDEEQTQLFYDILYNNSLEGVGIRIELQNDNLTVVAPLKDSPAENAGVRSGDIIIAVDRQSVQGEDPDVAATRIRGPKGTQVTLTILRGEQKIDIEITRDLIEIPTVEYRQLEGNIAHISIFQFSNKTASKFDDAVDEALKQGNTKIILDVRSNPGGVLESAVSIADRFLPLNSIILVEKIGGDVYKTHTAQTPPTLEDIPVVVLQNKGSASASEILTVALSENIDVPIVGETSFGKGTVQTVSSLAGKTSIKYTIAEWLTPNKMHIDGVGISPTVEVQNDPDTQADEQLNKAIEILQGL